MINFNFAVDITLIVGKIIIIIINYWGIYKKRQILLSFKSLAFVQKCIIFGGFFTNFITNDRF